MKISATLSSTVSVKRIKTISGMPYCSLSRNASNNVNGAIQRLTISYIRIKLLYSISCKNLLYMIVPMKRKKKPTTVSIEKVKTEI